MKYYPTCSKANITSALMALLAIAVMTACSPKPSAEEVAAQNKAVVEEAKKQILAEQTAEKAKQDALLAAQAEEKNRQDAAIAAARREGAADQRAAAARAASARAAAERSRSREASSDTPWESKPLPVQKSVCNNCGVVLAINVIEKSGKGSGLGVVAGGVVGGLLGNQVGGGTGKDVATVAGAIGGAVAGNAIEKNVKKTKSYDITVKMDTGEERIVHQVSAPNVVRGDSVKIENDVIYKM